MNQPIPIHAKSQENERLTVLTRAARKFAGRNVDDERFVLTDKGDGRLFQLDLAPGDVEVAAVSGPLILGGLDGDKYAADRAAPVRKVSKQFGNLQQFVTTTDLTKLVRPLGGAAGGQPVRANPIVKAPAYACKEWAVDSSVPNEVIANADHDLGSSVGAYVRDTWMLAREYAVAQLLTTPNNWATSNQTTPAALWSNTGSAKPVDDLMAALQVSKNPRPNLFVMSEQVGRYWYSNQAVQQFVMSGGLQALRLEILTIGLKFTSSGSNVDIWASVGNHAILVRADQNPDAMAATAGSVATHGGFGEVPTGAKLITSAATARWKGDEIRSVPQGETWVMVDDVLMRTFWEPRGGARGLCGCVLVVNDGLVMLDNALGAIIKTVA